MSSQSIAEKFQLPIRYQGATRSVWNEYAALDIQYKPLNLAVGLPDFLGPKHVTEALATTANHPNFMLNQYARDFGHLRLVKAISVLYSKLIDGKIDPFHEILVTSGASEAVYLAIHGYIHEGDEVIVIEPFFDTYEAFAKIAGGVLRYIPLRLEKSHSGDDVRSENYVLDYVELEALFNEKTKMIILNTPNNPIGKVYSREELTKIADLCKKYNVICVSDEVYEWMIYDDNEHVRICSLPGMWERTITIASGGKTFSVTGWRIGWAYGSDYLIKNLQIIQENCSYSCPTPTQEAMAIILETELTRWNTPDSYFRSLPVELQIKRDFMVNCLKSIGMKPITPQGGYFIIADWSPLEYKVDMSSELDPQRDYRFTKWLGKNVGLLGIPPSAFFSEKNKPMMENFVRFCFVKKEEKLQKAANILKSWFDTKN